MMMKVMIVHQSDYCVWQVFVFFCWCFFLSFFPLICVILCFYNGVGFILNPAVKMQCS